MNFLWDKMDFLRDKIDFLRDKNGFSSNILRNVTYLCIALNTAFFVAI